MHGVQFLARAIPSPKAQVDHTAESGPFLVHPSSTRTMVPSQMHRKRPHWYELAVPLRSNEGTCIYLKSQLSHSAVAGWTSQACLASQCWLLLQPKRPETRVAKQEAKPCLERTMANEKRLQLRVSVNSAILRESWMIDLTWMKYNRD